MRRYEDLDDLQQKAIDALYEHDEHLALLETGSAPTDDASLTALADALDTLENEVRRS